VALEGTERRRVLSVGGRGPSFRTDLLAVEEPCDAGRLPGAGALQRIRRHPATGAL